MKISMVIYGTRGDVQPMLALALGLRKGGHEVMLCAPPENEELVRSYDCPFTALGTSIKERFEINASKRKSPRTNPSAKFMKQEISNQITQLPWIIKGSDLVLAVGYVFGVPAVCESLNIPYRFVAFYPAILGGSKNAPVSGRILWWFGKQAMNLVLKRFINKKRSGIGVKPITDVWTDWMGDHVFVASFPALGEVPEGVDFKFSQTGYMFLPSKAGLKEEIKQFLESGPPPVFIGFGSNPIHSPEKLIRLLTEEAKTVTQRFIISRGWAGLKGIENTDECLIVDEVPYDLLFPRVALVVHHGGTGTMSATAKAGVPQVAFPFMADQFQNRNQIVKSSIGPYGCDFKKLSAKTLSNAIVECLSNDMYKKNAEDIAERIKGIDGVELTVQLIEKEFN
jgi:vancomycin aglycone glucosyltransferase